MPTSIHRLAATAGLAALAATSHAQTFDSVRLPGDPGKSELRLGVATIAGYKYMGSDERRYLLVPTIDYRSASGWFAGVGNGVGFRLGNDPQFQYGVRLTADLGRRERRSSALRGLGDIPTRPEVGVFLNAQATPEISVTTSLRYGSGDERRGLLFDAGVNYGLQLAPQWRLGTSLSATVANGNYMQEYFGINAQQASASGYNAYSAGAGVRDVKLGLSLTHFINRQWAVTAGVSAGALMGDAKDSPIVRERYPVTGLIGLGYSF